jgi:hypothetical protein
MAGFDFIATLATQKAGYVALYGTDPNTRGLGIAPTAEFPFIPQTDAMALVEFWAKMVGNVARNVGPCATFFESVIGEESFHDAYNAALDLGGATCDEDNDEWRWLMKCSEALGAMFFQANVNVRSGFGKTGGKTILTSIGTAIFWDSAAVCALEASSKSARVTTREKLEALAEGAKEGVENVGKAVGIAAEEAGDVLSRFFGGVFTGAGAVGLALIAFVLWKVG